VAGFFSGSPKSRRQSAVIQKLADMIGFNVKLYDMTLQFLRTLFLRTRNVHYCTLRSELLMALHDRYRTVLCIFLLTAGRVLFLLKNRVADPDPDPGGQK
jgi:hypothetical protein